MGDCKLVVLKHFASLVSHYCLVCAVASRTRGLNLADGDTFRKALLLHHVQLTLLLVIDLLKLFDKGMLSSNFLHLLMNDFVDKVFHFSEFLLCKDMGPSLDKALNLT